MPKESRPKLIPCPACGKKLSATAPACPKCGHVPTGDERAKAAKSARRGQVFGLIFGTALAVPIISSVHQCDRVLDGSAQPSALASAPSEIVRNSPEDGAVWQVQTYLWNNLDNPSSIEYLEWGRVIKKTSGSFGVTVSLRRTNGSGSVEREKYYVELDQDGAVELIAPM